MPATTLVREDVAVGWHRSCNGQASLSVDSPEALLNTLPFVPAAFFGVLAVQRVGAAVAAAALCSVAVEAVQLVTGTGTCETTDVLRNTAGALVAAALAAGVVRAGLAARTLTKH